MESQQFDTQLELLESGPMGPETYQTHNSVMRFDCEGTEVELDDRKDDSDQEIDRDYAMQQSMES